MAYIVNVAQLRVGPSKNEVFTQGDSIDLSLELAGKLLRKAYIKFDSAPSKKIVVVDDSAVSEKVAESDDINSSDEKHPPDTEEEKNSDNLSISFSVDEYVKASTENPKKEKVK